MPSCAVHEIDPATEASERLARAVFSRRRILRETLEAYGDLSVGDYIEKLSDYRAHPAYLPRLQQLGELMAELYTPRWGAPLMRRAIEKLVRRPVVLTADHAGMLVYPPYIQGNILFGLPEILREGGVINNFFSGLVPLDTASLPGGISLSETCRPQEGGRKRGGDRSGRKVNANLFLYTRRRTRHWYACEAPGYEKQKIEAAPGRIASLLNRGIIDRNKAGVLRDILRTHVDTPRVRREAGLIGQAALINRDLFRRYLPEAGDTHLLSFQLEQMAAGWLCRQLLRPHPESPTAQLLLDPEWRRFALERFDGINPGCWRRDDQGRLQAGTFLFWGIDADGSAVRLQEEAGALTGKNGFRVGLDRAALRTALVERKIVPSIFTVFCVLAFECGLCCFGGFMQCWYLEQIRRGWLSLLARFGLLEQARLARTVPVTRFVTGLTLFLFQRGGEAYLPDGADIILRGGMTVGEIARQARVPLRHCFLPALPFIYRSIYGADAGLEGIDIADILGETGLGTELIVHVCA